MRSHDQTQLKDELRLAGAKPEEIPGLFSIASQLERLGQSHFAGIGMPRPKTWGASLLKPLGVGAVGLAVGLLLIVASQSVLPTSRLFTVQRVTDDVAMAIHPEYRATVMMKRADQVNELVAKRASGQSILAALDDYTVVVHSYESVPHADYAAFQYCRSMLTQAMQEASPKVGQAIQASLDSLDTT